MKKTISKIFCVIMALCVFFGTIPMTVSAQDNKLYESEDFSMIKFSPETELPTELGGTINKFYSNGTDVDTTRYFYNQLTTNQKKIYEQVWAAGVVETIAIDLTGINIVGTTKTVAASSAQQDIMMALTALNEDNPMFFWSAGFGMSYGTTKTNGIYRITSLTIRINLDTSHFANFADAQAKVNAVAEKLETIKVNGISYHEKYKSIHDYIVNNAEYDHSISESNIFDVYGTLINGVCVCEGYAETFKLICDREGLPCITVIGTGNGGAHKWNMVQMEDGEWYTLDSTWNDQSDQIFYSYFLIGSNTKAPYFSGSTVADSTIHIPTGKLFSSAETALVYPTLSTDTYGVGILRYDAKDVHFDTARNVIMVGKNVTNYYNYVCNTGNYTRTRNGTGTTTSTLTVSDGTTTKNYLVAMRGDINASNTVTTDDYNLVVSTAGAKNVVTSNTAKFYAGDMTQDGAVDGFDAIALDLYQKDILKFD